MAANVTNTVALVFTGIGSTFGSRPELRGLGPTVLRATFEVAVAALSVVALFAAAVYVGSFGAAGGVILLVVLGSMLDLPLVRVNAVRNAVSGVANAVAALAFVLLGPVACACSSAVAAARWRSGWP